MSELDIRALEANLTAWKLDRAPALTEDKAFERYAVDQVLKQHDLSDEDVASGNLGGGDDGGVDGAYLFINDQLILDDTVISVEPTATVEMVLLQATRENGFKETRSLTA